MFYSGDKRVCFTSSGWWTSNVYSVEWELSEKVETLRENLLHIHFVHHKSQMTSPGIEPLFDLTNRPPKIPAVSSNQWDVLAMILKSPFCVSQHPSYYKGYTCNIQLVCTVCHLFGCSIWISLIRRFSDVKQMSGFRKNIRLFFAN
jgi:hypothetical protein